MYRNVHGITSEGSRILSKGRKWLIGKTDGTSIIKMLQDKITIRQLLLEYSTERITVDSFKYNYQVKYNSSDWNDPYLPKEDSYMYAEDNEFKEEIAYSKAICGGGRENESKMFSM